MNEHPMVRGRWVLADAETLVADGTVLVGGRIVLEDGRPTRIDEAAALADRLLPRLETYYRTWKRPRPVPYVAYNSRC